MMLHEFVISMLSFLAGFGARDLIHYVSVRKEAKKNGGSAS